MKNNAGAGHAHDSDERREESRAWPAPKARKLILTGRVQGVGYRPFVYNKAVELGLYGTVLNGSGKVFVHVEGEAVQIDRLEQALVHAAPPLARPHLDDSRDVEAEGFEAFSILASKVSDVAEIHVPPDLFTCDDCLDELTGEHERRFGYPFINCTQCGPRYTIITAMPYDRPNTSMAAFPLCDDCRAEYENPADRRFHAQPLACPECGPNLSFVGAGHARDSTGVDQTQSESRAWPPPTRSSPLQQAVEALQQGRILAIKGVGGYHLVCDAANDKAVKTLRERKRRPHKPLAVMFPLRGEDGLDAVREHLELDEITADALTDPARPIVLCARRKSHLSSSLAAGLRELGAFLPYSPLHHELLAKFGQPVVATSGNVSGEPVITDNHQAEKRLSSVADVFLHHDRPIVRPADDPVVRPMAGRARTIRPGRGIAPLELELPFRLKEPMLAAGGHMKNTVALAWDNRVVLSPHLGELDSPRSNEVFQQVINDLQVLYDVKIEKVACDLHPGYASTRWAVSHSLPYVKVQHHAAHASSLAGEYPESGSWLVFTWDGVGYGSDGTLWGGEALLGSPGHWIRKASFRQFKLVGGDKAGREPWRSAMALIWAVGAGQARDSDNAQKESRAWPAPAEGIELAHQAWKQDINTFETSAAGRLFDAAAALVLGRTMASFEGQGPMELEQLAVAGCETIQLLLEEDENGVLRADWSPLLPLLSNNSIPRTGRAGIFHESMAQCLLAKARHIRRDSHFDVVGLSGGVFQNRFLTERVTELLTDDGFEVRLHSEIPANDGGLSFGQIIEAAAVQRHAAVKD